MTSLGESTKKFHNKWRNQQRKKSVTNPEYKTIIQESRQQCKSTATTPDPSAAQAGKNNDGDGSFKRNCGHECSGQDREVDCESNAHDRSMAFAANPRRSWLIDGVAPLAMTRVGHGREMMQGMVLEVGSTRKEDAISSYIVEEGDPYGGEEEAEEAKVKPTQPLLSESQDTDPVTIGEGGMELQGPMAEQ